MFIIHKHQLLGILPLLIFAQTVHLNLIIKSWGKKRMKAALYIQQSLKKKHFVWAKAL